MKKNVLHLVGSFNQGGSERQAVQLARLLREDGTVNVFVGTMRREGPLLREVEALGLGEIPEFRIGSFYGPRFAAELLKCGRFLKKHAIDVVHSHDFYTNIFSFGVSLLARVEKRIASKRETGGLRSAAQSAAERPALTRADAVVANSDAVKRFLESRGVPSKKISVIHNGLDLGRMSPKTSDRSSICGMLGLPADPVIRFVVHVANLRHEVKNQEMLLRSAATLRDEFPEVHFVFAGEGERMPHLERLSMESGLGDRTHFLGRCEQVPELLSVASTGVLTSLHEGFPNSVLEYMSAGLPVVSTDVGGVSEVLEDGIEGFLVPSDDDAVLTQRLRAILSDRETAGRLGEAGRARVVGQFSTASQLRKSLELYGV